MSTTVVFRIRLDVSPWSIPVEYIGRLLLGRLFLFQRAGGFLDFFCVCVCSQLLAFLLINVYGPFHRRREAFICLMIGVKSKRKQFVCIHGGIVLSPSSLEVAKPLSSSPQGSIILPCHTLYSAPSILHINGSSYTVRRAQSIQSINSPSSPSQAQQQLRPSYSDTPHTPQPQRPIPQAPRHYLYANTHISMCLHR